MLEYDGDHSDDDDDQLVMTQSTNLAQSHEDPAGMSSRFLVWKFTLKGEVATSHCKAQA